MTGFVNAVAPALANAGINAIGSMFAGGGGNSANVGGGYYNTNQVDNALQSNAAYTGTKTRDQLEYEERARQNRAGYDLGQMQAQQAYLANMGNAAANANNARGIASNAYNALSNLYVDAGNRSQTAAANTMNAINNAGAQITGLFR